MPARLEHAHLTVSDPDATAAWLCDIFDWHVRWTGPVLGGSGYTVHVGTDDQYLALFRPDGDLKDPPDRYTVKGAMNHIALVVDDLETIEEALREKGFEPGGHADYAPGHRFYVFDHDGIEFEIVQYD